MSRVIHPIAGSLAFLLILIFWTSTLMVELMGSVESIVWVKTAVPYGLLLLVPSMIAVGASGTVLAKGRTRGLVGAKAKRMPVVAANGLLILVPAAFFLAHKARLGEFDGMFYGVQVLELMAGITNLSLLGMSMRDGLALTSWRRGPPKRVPPLVTRVMRHEEIAEGTLGIWLEKPEHFHFLAGQAAYLTVDSRDRSEGGGSVRTLSIASGPREPQLLFATRSTGSFFKRALVAEARVSVTLEGPFGHLVLHDDGGRPAVFLVGGIGITPVRSIIRDALARSLPHSMTLFYSNRSGASAAFLGEFRGMEKTHTRFTLVDTISDGVSDVEAKESGQIDLAMLNRHLDSLQAPIFYLVGSPGMVSGLKEMLRGAGVPLGHIRDEAFGGY